MTNPTQLQNLIGQNAVDADGAKIGKIGQIYLDDQTGRPVWVTVHTGMFGSKESFAPLYGSSVDGDTLKLAVTKDLVKDAPGVDADGHTSDEENDALYTHYSGYLGDDNGHSADYAETQQEDRSAAAPVAERSDDGSMIRSEERLHVGTEQVQGGKARLRKYIVTENVSTTVPVSHEEARIVREPITDATAVTGGDISTEEFEVTLKAERPVVEKDIVAVERVRLDTETVTEQVQVNETVRKEEIDQVEVSEPGQGFDEKNKK